MPSVASISSACKLAEQLCLMQHARGMIKAWQKHAYNALWAMMSDRRHVMQWRQRRPAEALLHQPSGKLQSHQVLFATSEARVSPL